MTKSSTPAGPATSSPEVAAPAWRRWLPPVLLVLAMLAAYASGLHRHLDLEAIVLHRDALKQAVESNRTLALLGYIALYAGSVALSFPGAALLTLLGGFLFGGIPGGVATVLAATLGAVAVFLVARSALGEALRRRAGARLGRLLDGFRSDAASYLLFLRLVPAFPFWLVNLAAALSGVKLGVFAWTTMVGIIPGTFAFSVAGAGLDSVIAAQAKARAACEAAGRAHCAGKLDLKAILTPELLLASALLGCAALIPVIWRRISKHRRAEQGDRA